MLLQYIAIALMTLVSAAVGYLMGIAKPWLDKRFNQVPVKMISKGGFAEPEEKK